MRRQALLDSRGSPIHSTWPRTPRRRPVRDGVRRQPDHAPASGRAGVGRGGRGHLAWAPGLQRRAGWGVGAIPARSRSRTRAPRASRSATSRITGSDAGRFHLMSTPSLPTTIPVGGSANVQVSFAPTSVGPKGAFLQITSDDPDHAQLSVSPRAWAPWAPVAATSRRCSGSWTRTRSPSTSGTRTPATARCRVRPCSATRCRCSDS